jgi:arsenite methyltransferase
MAECGFAEVSIEVKPESGELVATWAAGRGIENHVRSATIEARKPITA